MSRLERLFRSTDEQPTPVQATVTGDWPSWLNGALLRVAPAVWDLEGGFSMSHWCDGFSTIYKFNIQEGKVDYSKRYLQSEAFERAQKNGKPVMSEFGTKAYTDMNRSFLSRAISQILPDVTDNCSGNIIKLGQSYFATTDTANFRVIYPDDLSTGDKVDLYKLLGVHIVCSHTVRDRNGDSYALATSLVTGLKYNLIKIPDNNNSAGKAFKDAKIICTIGSRWKTCICYYHSFGLTENYIVFIEQPFIMNGVKILSSQIKGKSMQECLEWTPEHVNRFYIIEKQTGKVLQTKYKSNQPFFLFHHINAYEENGEIIVDMIAHDSPEIIQKMFLSNLRHSQLDVAHKSEPRRFIIPIVDNIKVVPEGTNLVKAPSQCGAIRKGDSIELTHQLLSSPAFELPTVNRKYFGRKYKYFYATGLYDVSDYQFCVVKVDVDEGKVQSWYAGDGQVPSESIFIERPDSKTEDDGILLVCITTSQPSDIDRMVILDAVTMQEIATATVPSHIPTGLHGMFIKKS